MFLKAGVLSLLLLLASRVLGLLRESAQAAVFGTSAMGDVAVLMLTLPDLVTGLLASGAMAYVLLPHWAGQTPQQRAGAQRRVAVGLLAFGWFFAASLWLARPLVLVWLAPGLNAAAQALAANALVWSALALPPSLLAALWVTRLQFERDFVGMYAGNLVVNLVLVAALAGIALLADRTLAILLLGLLFLLAMVLRLVWLCWRMHRVVRRNRQAAGGLAGASGHADQAGNSASSANIANGAKAGTFPLPSVWLWAALSAGLPLALPFVARSMASGAGPGALVTFNYAWKLVELPLVLAIQLVASLAFPAVAHAFAHNQQPAHAVRRAFLWAWTLACAAAAALWVGAPAIAQLLFGWGRMSAADVTRIADWGAAGALGLLPQAMVAVALTVLASVGQMRVAVWAYAAALMGLLVWGPGMDGRGLMSLLNYLLAGVALVVLARLRQVAPLAGTAWLPLPAMAVAAALMLAAGWLAGTAPWQAWQALQPNPLLGLALAGAVAVVIIAGAALAERLGSPSVQP